MNNTLITVTGIAASTFTAVSLLPQLVKIWREKKAEGISFLMLGVLFAGLLLWVCYGIMNDDPIITIANSTSLAINAAIGVLAFRFRHAKNS